MQEFQRAPNRNTKILLTVSLVDTSFERLQEALNQLEIELISKRRVVSAGMSNMYPQKQKAIKLNVYRSRW